MSNPYTTPEHRKKVYHEAGHAVVGFLSGGTLKYIVTNPANGGDYCACVSFDSLATVPERLTSKATTLMAGSLGDWIGTGNEGKPDWFEDKPFTWDGAIGDYKELRQTVLDSFDNDQQLWIDSLADRGKDQAWELLNTNRAAVIALAEALMPNNRMEGQDAIDIIKRHVVLS